MKYKKQITLLAIPMPNHLQYETLAGNRQDGINLHDNRIAITELTEEEAIEYGEFLKQEFIGHYRQAKAIR